MKKLSISKAARDLQCEDVEDALCTDTNPSTPAQADLRCYAVYARINSFGKIPFPRAAPQKVYKPLTREQAEELRNMFAALCALEDRLDIVHGVPPQGSAIPAISSSIKMSSMHARRALLKSIPALIAS